MPRLLGSRTKRPFDVYDSFSPRMDPRGETRIHLFGDVNIGYDKGHLSNMQVPRQLNGADLTSVICNWYARTNIPMPPAFAHPSYVPSPEVRPTELEQAFTEFAMSTIVTMQMGDWPVAQLPLDQLLRRRHGDRPNAMQPRAAGVTELVEKPNTLELAELLYRDFRNACGPATELPTWDEITPLGRTPWQAAAHCAKQYLTEPVVTIVPVRQSCHAHVEFMPAALAKLRELLLPVAIAPMPLVWVHFDGFYVRDVC